MAVACTGPAGVEQRAQHAGHIMQRLETVGEGEVSDLFASSQNFQLLGFGNAKLQGLGQVGPATDSMGYLMVRNASFDR